MKKLLLLFIVVFCSISAFAQKDSLLLKNGNTIVGEIKSMDRGVLQIETPYSDADFRVEWDGILEIYSDSYFLITLSNGTRLNGSINTSSPNKVTIKTDEGESVVDLQEIVYANSLKKSFWSKLHASIDLGWSLTKANNLQQFTVRSNIGYLTDRWGLEANYNDLKSRQDEVADVNRTDASLGARYFLPKDWFFVANISLLSNTEQSLRLRTTAKAGVGKYVIHTNRTFWNFSVGINYNDENFYDVLAEDGSVTTPATGRTSEEAFLASNLDMFDVGDLSLATGLTVYPSITEPGRTRADFNFDMKYDLPLDFYIKYGITVNYDNQPIEAGKETDYVSQLTFGWEL